MYITLLETNSKLAFGKAMVRKGDKLQACFRGPAADVCEGIVHWEVYQIVYLMLDKSSVKMTVFGLLKKSCDFSNNLS